MNDLTGKTALIVGASNERSLAWGIARALHERGARLAFTCGPRAGERRVRPLAERVGSDFVEPCDLTDDAQIDALFAKVAERLGGIDVLVHGAVFAKRDELGGRFVETSREGFHLAHDVSVYSLIALARGALPLMRPGGSILTLSYYGAEKMMPSYNVMGVAKAALESAVRYLAADLGADGLRVNAISAGPVRTLSAAGISGFRGFHNVFPEVAPLRRQITIEDVGETAAFLCSDAAGAITGEVLYVDAGFAAVSAGAAGKAEPERRTA